MNLLNENKSQKPSSLDEMLKKASQKLGTSPENLKKVAEEKNINHLLKNISAKESQKIEKTLSNKEELSKLLSTPKAQQLLKKLLGEK